jgi:hypothetical protein
MSTLAIALLVAAVLVVLTVALQRGKPSPRVRRGDQLRRRREERDLL